ncbi:MAG: ATP-binding protein [Bryobacteraceae bacterium]
MMESPEVVTLRNRIRELELALGKYQYDALINTIPQIVFTASSDGEVKFVNEAAAAYTGLAPEALHGGGWRQVLHPDDLNRLPQFYSKLEGECRIAGAGQDYRWFLVRVVPLPDGAGKVRNWLGTCTDIDSLRNRRTWGQEILDGMPVGVMVAELGTGIVKFSNRAAKEFEAADFRSDSGGPLLHPAARVAAGELLNGVQMSCDSTAGRRELLASSFQMPDTPGEAPASIVIIQDVSSLAQLRQDLAKAKEDVQQFVYAASHDLQEPLRMVSGYIQLLARRYTGKLDEDADQYIQFAVDGADRMGQLIRDLLTLSRMGNPDTRRLERVGMTSVVQWALMNLQPAVAESQAAVTQDALPDVTVDQARLALVLQHLIGNSIKFRSADPPRIHVTARRQEEQWVFCVEDNGAGFEMKHAEKIFGVFKRLHGKEIPGTGVGLALARKIVEIHQGRMWAESEPGKGSRFYFTLPAGEQ